MKTTKQNSCSTPEILQIARDIGPGGGINGVAYALEKEFQKCGIPSTQFTLNNIRKRLSTRKIHGLFLAKLKLIFDILYFTIVGTVKVHKIPKPCNQVSICHGDVLYGDIYVNHGLHRAMVLSSPSPLKLIVRNPFHLFLLSREWIRFNLNIHKKIVCFGAIESESLIKNYPKTQNKIHLISNGVDVEKFSPNENTRATIRNQLGFTQNEFMMIFVGHEFRRKGLSIAIDSLKHLPNNVFLVVVGGNSTSEIDAAKIQAAKICIGERIRFLGRRSDVNELMCGADAFVLPTHYETWALVGLEAMSCGTPAIMTAVGGIKEYLKDGVNGYFIERTAEDLAKKILDLMSDRKKLENMRANARNSALAFSWDVVAKKYLDLVEEVAKDRLQHA